MGVLRYSIGGNWICYLFLASYAYLVTNMTLALWFGDGVNIFASYAEAPTLRDANEVYWFKTCFLIGVLLLTTLRFDFRVAAGLGAMFWAGSLIYNFGLTQNLIIAAVLGTLVVIQQVWRGEVFVEAET
jgi:hypothetical protein